mgnify:CR=1 FL=1
MGKLFIIGNGFDSAHCLNTSYDEFRKYLCNTYMNGESGEDYMPMVPTVSIGPKGEEICDMEEIASFLVYLISIAEPDGSKWSDLEASLGRLDYDEAFDTLPEELDDDGDINYWHELYNNEDMASNLYTAVAYVKDLFAEWVDDIDVENAKAKPSFLSLIEPEDIFLTFNYTETLEEVYGLIKIEYVIYMESKVKSILFGHGNTRDYTDEYMKTIIGDTYTRSEINIKEPTLQTVDLYPESYLKINPIVINKCKKITQKPTKTLINQITDEILEELNEKNTKDDIKRAFIQTLSIKSTLKENFAKSAKFKLYIQFSNVHNNIVNFFERWIYK